DHLVPQDEPVPLPRQQLDPVVALADERENRVREWILADDFLREQCQPRPLQAHVDGLAVQVHANPFAVRPKHRCGPLTLRSSTPPPATARARARNRSGGGPGTALRRLLVVTVTPP